MVREQTAGVAKARETQRMQIRAEMDLLRNRLSRQATVVREETRTMMAAKRQTDHQGLEERSKRAKSSRQIMTASITNKKDELLQRKQMAARSVRSQSSSLVEKHRRGRSFLEPIAAH